MLLKQNDEGDRAKARYLLEEPAAISSEPGMRSLAELDSSRREILVGIAQIKLIPPTM